jgi:hypothetical protein
MPIGALEFDGKKISAEDLKKRYKGEGHFPYFYYFLLCIEIHLCKNFYNAF